jgi:hypothetical protein
LFKAQFEGVDAYITMDGITYVLTRRDKKQGVERQLRNNSLEEDERGRVEWRRISMRFIGARIRRENILAERPSDQGYFNYYLSHSPQGILNVQAFRLITIRDIYPGIDWRLSDDGQRGFKQEFIVHPGARPNDIRMMYAGAGTVAERDNGRSLSIRTTLGEIEEGALLSHQGNPNQPVSSRYSVRGNDVRFVVGAYNSQRDLIIDPFLFLKWSTLYGGNGVDGPYSLAFDASNNVYVVGYTSSTSFPIQPMGSAFFQANSASGIYGLDAFIIKFNSAGVRQWATFYGSAGDDTASGVVADKSGNIYVTGWTTAGGNLFPTMAPINSVVTVQTNSGGLDDAFLLKFDSSGVREWATLYGGNDRDYARGITADPRGNVYITGTTMSSNLPTNLPPGGSSNWQSANAGAVDSFVAKYNPRGVREWARYYGGSGLDQASAITWHDTRLVSAACIAGTTNSTNLPLKAWSGGYNQSTPGGNDDAFLFCIKFDGLLHWSTYYGGNGYDSANAIASGGNYVLYVAGSSTPVSTTAPNSFPTLNPGSPAAYYRPTYIKPSPYPTISLTDYSDAFIVMFDYAFVRRWATLFGGTDLDSAQALAVDNLDNVHVAGITQSTDLPVQNPGGFFDPTHNGGQDVFLASFNRPGIPQWVTYAGGNGRDFPRTIGSNSLNCLFVAGEFNSMPTLLPLLNPGGGVYFQNTSSISNNYDEGFLMKFCH